MRCRHTALQAAVPHKLKWRGHPVLSLCLRVPHSGPWVSQADQQGLGWLSCSRREALAPHTPPGQHEAGPGAGVSPSVCEMWQPVTRISSSKWLPVIMCCCCVLCCGWEPWLGRIPSFKGKQNKMSLLVLKESAIINVICLFFKVRDVPKNLCGREVEAYTGGTFPKADLHVWQSLDESLGVLALSARL